MPHLTNLPPDVTEFCRRIVGLSSLVLLLLATRNSPRAQRSPTRRTDVPVSEFLIPSNAANGNFAVLARIAAIFAPHEADPASLAVVIDSGHVRAGNTLIEVAKQLVDGIVAPTTSPRIDRVVVDSTTGEASLLTGAENGPPVPPAPTTGSLPVAQLALSPGMTAKIGRAARGGRVVQYVEIPWVAGA